MHANSHCSGGVEAAASMCEQGIDEAVLIPGM